MSRQPGDLVIPLTQYPATPALTPATCGVLDPARAPQLAGGGA